MKTDTLIDMLARNAGPAPRALAAKRLSPAAVVGALASAWAAVAWFGLIPWSLFGTPAPWTKMAYGGALAAAAAWWAARLSRPAAPIARPRGAVVGVVLATAAAGLVSWLSTPADGRSAALLGHSWAICPPTVLALSLPALAAALWAVRGLAPTRPRAAGFAAGLMAGSVGAMGYALACPEASVAFVAVWYSLGILLTGALGAALGARVLRW
ncbi:MAG: hypothetical protein RJA99_701 [Pseudomonadota bacterium]|jgi:hypothetical protein